MAELARTTRAARPRPTPPGAARPARPVRDDSLRARRDADSPPPSAGGVAPLGDSAPSALGEDWLACAACGAFVALARDRASVNGAHSHSFINPAGLIFRVGCFSEAPGARSVGEESAHFTWFPGFVWRVAICQSCADHLGWSYRSGSASFVALIEERLVERRAPQGPPG